MNNEHLRPACGESI